MGFGITKRGAERAIIALATTLAATAAHAQATPLPDAGKLAAHLAGLFVVATLLESALTTIFNWRVYREFFNGRAVKTLIMIAFGYAIVELFKYDVVADIIRLSGGTEQAPTLSRILSALVLAGGSAAVYELFKALGLRPPVDPASDRPQPEDGKAWVSVRIIRDKAIGEVRIYFEELADAAATDSKAALAGVVGTWRGIGRRLISLFFADPMRFPSYGGRTVDVSKVYRITAEWTQQGAAEPITEKVYQGRFASRAIIDLVKRA